MTDTHIHPEWREDAALLQQRLEEHWHHRYRPEELRQRLETLLLAIKKALARNSADARFVVAVYRRILEHRASEEEKKQANRALKRILKELGLVVIGILPFSFVTLPGLFALAHHYHIDLLPDEEEPAATPPPAGNNDSSDRPG
ncbi:MAG TPA: hypothetical protein ENK27_05450 [Desulfobulbus sp.]|nr:hypothetical protein [Desulfobulbus sp.]